MKLFEIFFFRKAFLLLFLLCTCAFLSGCRSIEHITLQHQLEQAYLAEYHGQNSFWPYANAGHHAGLKGDYLKAQEMYLRAYRNTSVLLLSPPPAPKKPATLRRAIFGVLPELLEMPDTENYVAQLDILTPLPGQNVNPDETLNHITNFWRSLASYNWALYAARLGQFEEAEIALRYSLELERIRDPGNKEELTPSRHFELARLYRAWGRTSSSIEEFRLGFQIVPSESVIQTQSASHMSWMNTLRF